MLALRYQCCLGTGRWSSTFGLRRKTLTEAGQVPIQRGLE